MSLRMMRFARLGAALVTLCVSACATTYSAKPIAARVVDADSGVPLEGVNVVAHWLMEDPVAARGQGDLELMETVTDRNGEFQFPAWGPKAIPTGTPPGTRLTNQDPAIIFFKSGYWPHAVSNDSHPSMLNRPQDLGEPVRDSQWDSKAIKLKRFNAEPQVYVTAIGSVLTSVSWGECGWKRIPRMIIALNRESDRLKGEGVVKSAVAWPSIAHLEANEARHKCGSVGEVFKDYQK